MTEIGPVGRSVIANIEALRAERRLSLDALSQRLREIGRPILPSVLGRLKNGGRRVDADDLAAFAAVFEVTPLRLLATPGTAEAQDHPSVRAAHALADRLAALLAAGGQEAASHARAHAVRALRRALLEAEELLAETEGNATA